MDAATKPFITAVVASFNEERHIRACLDSLFRQQGVGPIDVVVIDGMSTDRTVEIVRSYPQMGTRLRLIENPRRLQVFAWNMGIAEAQTPYVALFSAHAEWGDDYLAQCLNARERTGAANVGGVQVPVHDGSALGEVIAWAMGSRFGIGNAQFRYAKEECFVDSGFGAFFETEMIRKLGGYDERLPVGEDADLNYRIRQAGHRIFSSPKIKVRYHARSSLQSLAKQLFRYGYWRRATQLKHPEYVPMRVLAPPIFVVMLVGSLAALLGGSRVGWIVPLLYGVFCAIAAACAVRTIRRPSVVLVPIVLLCMHLSYGIGWLAGLLAHRRATFAIETQ